MKLFIVEDFPIVREHIKNRCAALGDWELAGESGSVNEAVRLLSNCRPDIILLDIGLPDGDGFTVADYARTILPEVGFLIFSGHLNEHTVAQCDRLRVRAFVDKLSACTPLLDDALRAIAAGNTYFSHAYLTAKRSLLADSRAISKLLSNAELLVLRLVARGLSDAEIGRDLNITEKTAKTHRGRILRKLCLPCTPKLIAHANERGFGQIH